MSKQSTPYLLNKVSKTEAELLIYQEIGSDMWGEGITAKQFAADLKAIGNIKRITVRINSPGGSVFDGLAIYNALLAHKADVEVQIDGMALSMASVIAMAGNKIRMAENALMMVHNPYGVVIGSASDMRRQADVMDKMQNSIALAYENQTQLGHAEIVRLMDDETWMDAEEAVASGFAHEIGGTPLQAAARCRGLPDFTAKFKHVRKLSAFLVDESEDGEMSQDNKPAAASVEQLKSLPGSDSDFVVAQLSAGATLTEAMSALNASLVARLHDANEKTVAADAALAALKAEAAARAGESEGTDPIEHASGGDGNPTFHAWDSDPLNWHRGQMSLRMAKGMTATQAAKDIDRQFPEFVAAMCQN